VKRADESGRREVAREKLQADDKPVAAGMAKAEKDQAVTAARALSAPSAAQNAAKAAAPLLRCFELRQPTDSTKRILKLSAGALADSVRLGTLLERSDSLFDSSRRFVARSVRCTEP
jgi:hypothetical protein